MKLKATLRVTTGHTSRLRAEGRVPAVVYGHHAKPLAIALDGHEFRKVLAHAGRTHLIDLELDGGKAHKVLVKEVQHHPRRQGAIHVDLYEVSMKEKLHVEVPVHVVGESPIVKRGDADLLQIISSLNVECLPGDIPEAFEVDVSALDEIDAGIRIEELKVPEGVTLLTEKEELIVKVTARRTLAAEDEAEAAAEPAAEGEEGAEAQDGEEAAKPEE